MSISFLSKLSRLNYAANNLSGMLNSVNFTRINVPQHDAHIIGNNDEHDLRCIHSRYRVFRRNFSSTSGSDEDDKSKNKSQQSLTSTEERPPPPACASLSPDFTTTPLEEHEIGLNLSRRRRSKQPMGDGITLHKPQSKGNQKPGKDKPDNSPTTPASSPPRGRPCSRKRAKDRLEQLSPQDCERRLLFACKLLLLVEDEPDILDNILWTDECNFNLPKLSSLIKKPPIAESELLPQIAWCGISTQGTVGPYFFNSHVTDRTYLKMLENFLIPELEQKGYNLKELWFQQDGAPWHRSKLVLDFLTSVFDYRLISLGTKFTWPPRSQDLTPMDYFFWDYMKVKLDFKHSKYDLCFQKSFREILTKEVNSSNLNTLQGAIYQLPERLEMCANENGGRFIHLLYPDRYEKDGTRKPKKTDDDLSLLAEKSTSNKSNNAGLLNSNILDKCQDNIDLQSENSSDAAPPLPNTINTNNNNSNNNPNLTQP